MSTGAQSAKSSKAMWWTGAVLSVLPALFLLFDGAMKLVKPAFVVEGTLQYGYAESVLVPLGIVLIASTLLYLLPRTAIVGGILLTGYLGGAVATHVQAGEGWFSILFPVFFGVLLWTGLALRNAALRRLIIGGREQSAELVPALQTN